MGNELTGQRGEGERTSRHIQRTRHPSGEGGEEGEGGDINQTAQPFFPILHAAAAAGKYAI